MSFQWTLVAGFLYLEIALVTLFLLPWIKPRRWQKIFHSRLLKAFNIHSQLYFSGFIIILILLFSDAVRESYKYQTTVGIDPTIAGVGSENQLRMKLFRAQRNFYISGFSLFLWLVLRRLITLISYQSYLEATTESSMKQALSATEAANRLISNRPIKKKKFEEDNDDDEIVGDIEENYMDDDAEAELLRIKDELENTKRELELTTNDFDVMKKQAETVNIEYDRLLADHADLQKRLDRENSFGNSIKKSS